MVSLESVIEAILFELVIINFVVHAEHVADDMVFEVTIGERKDVTVIDPLLVTSGNELLWSGLAIFNIVDDFEIFGRRA